MTEGSSLPFLRQKHVQQLMKTEMCNFFLSNNRCRKGSRCAFAHSLTEIREKPDLNKTSMCKSFLQSGNCSNANCTFAHDERGLRATATFHKTKLCRFATSGRCKHGNTCRFAHSVDELPLDGRPDFEGAGQFGNSLTEAVPMPMYAGTQSTTNSVLGEWVDSDPQSLRDTGSDQSTRADISASVPTPEGSGDSGAETTVVPTFQYQNRRQPGVDDRSRRLRGERVPGRHCTTTMVTNVPSFLTQGALVSLLEDFTPCMRGAFDFFYCPWDPFQDRNLGYAIINFLSRPAAADFERQWGNQPLLPGAQGGKRLRIVPAALQGRAANLRHFSGFSLAHHEDPRFRPLVRAAGNEPLRPMALSEELVQAQQVVQPSLQPPTARTFPNPQQQQQQPQNQWQGAGPCQQQMHQQQVQPQMLQPHLLSQHQQQMQQQQHSRMCYPKGDLDGDSNWQTSSGVPGAPISNMAPRPADMLLAMLSGNGTDAEMGQFMQQYKEQIDSRVGERGLPERPYERGGDATGAANSTTWGVGGAGPYSVMGQHVEAGNWLPKQQMHDFQQPEQQDTSATAAAAAAVTADDLPFMHPYWTMMINGPTNDANANPIPYCSSASPLQYLAHQGSAISPEAQVGNKYSD